MVQKDKLWLLPLIPLILTTTILSFSRGSKLIDTVMDDKQDVCVDSGSRQSSRMSLGEKLLARDYQNLQSQSMTALYEGVAAFARCEFSTATKKLQGSLNISKNNPEALIYRNNAVAIAQKHFKIAVSVPLANKPSIAREILRGVAQAQTEINHQGGIEQKLLLVQIVSDDNDPVIVRQVAQKLAEDPSILAVVGHQNSNSSLAASEIYQKEGLLMISPTSASTELSGIGSYILRTTPSVALMANSLTDYASVSSFSKIVLCFDSESSASNSFVREFILELERDGGKIARVKCDLAQEDLSPQSIVEQAIAQNADALLLASSTDEISKAIAIARANRQRLPLLGSYSLYTHKTIEQGKNDVVGMVLPSPWIPKTDFDSDFSQTAIDYWGGKVNWRTAMAYDATKAIIQGLKYSHTRSELQSTMTQPDFKVNGATGVIRFNQSDRLGQAELAYIKKSGKNSEQYQFAPLKFNINPN